MPSNYYKTSIALGSKFQRDNQKNWSGKDSKNYHNQIRFLMNKYQASSVLDYGCGKGYQYTEPSEYYLLESDSKSDLVTFDQVIGAQEVFKYDPCVPAFDRLPEPGKIFDAVICTQVLGSIPDGDLGWIADQLASYARKFVFIGLHNQEQPPKSKKQIYNQTWVNPVRSVNWYLNRFCNWSGPPLYWWFRDLTHDIMSWWPYHKNEEQNLPISN